MRHKYETPAIVLARSPLGEANALLTLLTRDVGLVRARAQGLRKPSAKLASSLTTLAESDVTLLRGSEGWRLSGAVLREGWCSLLSPAERSRLSRVVGLVVRLVPGELADPALHAAFVEFLEALTHRPPEDHDSAECLAVLRILAALGLDDGAIPALSEVSRERRGLVMRINRGIELSGL